MVITVTGNHKHRSRINIKKVLWLHLMILYSITGIKAQSDTVSPAYYNHLTTVPPGALNRLVSYSDNSARNKGYPFIDSIRIKSSRNRITRKLYEIIVVAPDSVQNKNVSEKSDYGFHAYSGKRIGKIIINRMPVFGSDIDHFSYDPYKGQGILNKSHVNTLEFIIRNNLLFSTGDTVSPITFSDNERLLRDLPFIDDARIVVIPKAENEVDVMVVTKDVYSLGGSFSPFGFDKGRIAIFDNNFLGFGHELGFEMPFDNAEDDSPGFGAHFILDNPVRTFARIRIFYNNDIGENSYGIDISRRFVSSTTKYAGGIQVRRVDRNKALDTLQQDTPLRFAFQDYWLTRSFLLNSENVTRLLIGGRYTNNNVFTRPEIGPDQYHSLQQYRSFLGSIALSQQKFYKANLVHQYGRVEDVPYGGIIKITLGREINEFKTRNYAASELGFARSFPEFGYLYFSTGLGAFVNNGNTEQGIFNIKSRYFSNLLPVGRHMIRSFINIDYTRGFDRNLDENLNFMTEHGFSGFSNDSIIGRQRLTLNLEAVVFNPVNIYGFKAAFFGFADFSSLTGTNQLFSNGTMLTGLGIGMRIRNDNLIFNTFQIRIGIFPDAPGNSRISNILVTGEGTLGFDNFDSDAPSMIPFR